MSYIDEYNDTELNKLTRRLTNLYRHAFQETWAEQADYWQDLERRVQKEYAAYQQGVYTKQQWEDWVRAQIGRGKTLDAKAADIANRLAKTGEIASGYINGTGYKVFAENANYEAFTMENDYASSGISFNLVDEDALEALETDNHIEFDARWKKTFAQPKEIYKWNYDRVQTSVYQGILRGESAYQIADRIQQVTNSSRLAALRNARTSITSAANAGTMATFERAKDMGLDVMKEWVSFHDARTRDSHAYLDGVRVEWDEDFPNGLRYPGDPNGAPAEVYNCRCTLVRARHGEEKRTDNDVEAYEEWKAGKESGIIQRGDGTYQLYRESGNKGVFKGYPEKMSKKHIREVANEFDVDLKGIRLTIDATKDKINLFYTGLADEKVGGITFFPNAFKSKEELIRTIYHEKQHVEQYKEFGVDFVQNNRAYFETLAYSAENEFMLRLKREGRIK